MRFTPTYKLGSFETNQPLIPLEDSRRFLTIDRQLLGLFEIMSNGVLTGWDVLQRTGLTVAVSPGSGNVSFMAAETTEPRTVTGLLPNATNYVYAQAIAQTRFNRDVDFFSDPVLLTGTDVILLAKIVTNSNSVLSIDTSVRSDISFIEQIKQLINQHRHRGGLDNPSKIDLRNEVTGQLPGFRIEGLDANKIVSGVIDPARIPPLEHSDLLHSGVLTHAQLDSFVRNLSNPNVRLLGELAATNMLQLWLIHKHMWHDCDSETTNTLLMIPGISPDSFTDFQATTAVIDKYEHSISGILSLEGQLLTTTFRTQSDFDNAFLNVNIETGDTPSYSFFRLSKPFSETVVDGFDNVFSDNAEYPDWDLETIASNSQSSFLSDKSQKVDGAFSAKLKLDQSFRIQVTRFFSEAQDWTNYNELEISIQTLSASHGQIWLSVLGGTEASPIELANFKLLNANEVTAGFQRIVQDLLTVTRTSVIGLRIYTDTSLGWDLTPVTLNVDTIKLNNNLFYTPSGILRFRFETPQASKWAAISWDGDLNGGSIKVRSRSAPNFAVLDQSNAITFQPATTVSGDPPNVPDNVCIEVEVALAADTTRTASPVIRTLTLSYISSAEGTGLSIDTADDFLRASKLANTKVQSPGDVLIEGRIDVGDIVFGHVRSLQQIDQFQTPIYGVTGSDLFISPVQAAIPDLTLRQPSLNGVTTTHRLQDRTYLITDAINDRVLLFDRDGQLVRGIASNNIRNVDKLYPLMATYNPREEILYVCWSRNVKLSGVDLSKMTLRGAGVIITLSNSLDKVVRVQGSNTELESANVTAIEMSKGHALELKDFLDATGISDSRLFIEIDPDAVTEGIDTTNANYATLVGARGMNVFVGDVTFIKGVFRPISASITASGNWLVGNAKPLATGSGGTDILTGTGRGDVTSVIEIEPSTGLITFSDDSVDFSTTTLGNAVEYRDGKYIAVAGIESEDSSSSTTTTTTESSSTTVVSEQDALKSYTGKVKIVEKRSGRVVFDQPTSEGTYGADVQVDADENLVVIEKAFDGDFGKGRVVKVDEDGNVFFQYGLAELASPNDVRILSNGNLMVSS